LSLRKEDGYGDTRLHPTLPVEHRLRPASLFAHALEREETGYLPYNNIEKVAEDQYRIVMAVAGFGRDDVEIVQEQNRLTVRGKLKLSDTKIYLHHGIATRSFERRFDLADYVEVTDATMGEGLLVIALKAPEVGPEDRSQDALEPPRAQAGVMGGLCKLETEGRSKYGGKV
jgi:HSP20 family molecular chaperone IbpA